MSDTPRTAEILIAHGKDKLITLEESLELTRRNVEFTRTLEREAAALKAKVDRYEKALSKIIAEPNESLSDSKCVRFMVEYAKKAMKGAPNE